jgi:hypothetical protein
MRKLALAVALTAVATLGACKKTGEGEYKVVTPDVNVSTDTSTVKTPSVEVGKETTQVVTPTVDVKGPNEPKKTP